MLPTWRLMREDPGLAATYRALLVLSAVVLVLPGLGVEAGAVAVLAVATVWGVRLGAWVHEDRAAGHLTRAQVHPGGPGRARGRRLLAGFAGAHLGGTALALPHALLAVVVLLPEPARTALLSVPLAALVAGSGFGVGIALHPVLRDATTPAASLGVVGAVAGYWSTGAPALLSVPPTLLVASVVPPPTTPSTWAWGALVPLVSAGLPPLLGAAAALGSADPAGVDPRWGLVLAPLVLVGAAAGAPDDATTPDQGPRLLRSIYVLPAQDRPEAEAALESGDPGPPASWDLADLPVRTSREVVVYVVAQRELALPQAVTWDGGRVTLGKKIGSRADRWNGTVTGSATLWTGVAHLTRTPGYDHDGLEPVPARSPTGFQVFYGGRLPQHPLWASAATAASLASAAVVVRWWRGSPA